MDAKKNAENEVAATETVDTKELPELIEQLQAGSRRDRQHAAADIYELAKQSPESLTEHIDLFIDSLNRPEAQTRWELLEVLTILVDFDARSCAKALPEAETSLFDEESGLVRLSAVRFLCKLGATTANRSEKVWPLIDEAIQCYHGDLEFNDMLTALVEFSFTERMSFDAANSKGTLGKRAQAIVENLEAKA